MPDQTYEEILQEAGIPAPGTRAPLQQLIPPPTGPQTPVPAPTMPFGSTPQQPQENNIDRSTPSGGFLNNALNAAAGYFGANGFNLKPTSIMPVIAAAFGATNNRSPISHENAGNVTSMLTNGRLSPVNKAIIDELVPAATRSVQEGSVHPLLTGAALSGVNAVAARFGEKHQNAVRKHGINAAATTIDNTIDQVRSTLGPRNELTPFGQAYELHQTQLPKAQAALSAASRRAGSGNPTVVTKIPENKLHNESLQTTIGAKTYKLQELETRYKELSEGLASGKYKGGAAAAAKRTIALMDSELPKLRAQMKAETVVEPNKNYQRLQSAESELQKVTKKTKEVSNLAASDPTIIARLQSIDNKLSTDMANQQAFRKDPLKWIASEDMETYLKGSHQLNGTRKDEALNRLTRLASLRPETRQSMQRTLITRGLEDIKLQDIMSGTADMGKLKQSVSRLNLSDDAIKVIFGNDAEKGRELIRTLQTLPDALKSATAAIDPRHIGSGSIGSSGTVKLGLFAAVLDPDAWVNLFTKKEFQKDKEAVTKSLQFLTDPKEIQRYGKTLNPGMTSVIMRNVEERLKAAKENKEPVQQDFSVGPIPRVVQ